MLGKPPGRACFSGTCIWSPCERKEQKQGWAVHAKGHEGVSRGKREKEAESGSIRPGSGRQLLEQSLGHGFGEAEWEVGLPEGPEQRPRASVTHRACGHKQGGCCHVAHQALKFSCLLPDGPFQAPMTGPPHGAPSQKAHEQTQRVTADSGTSQEKGELVLASRSHDDNGANPLSLRSAPHHSGPFPASPTIAPDTPATHFPLSPVHKALSCL